MNSVELKDLIYFKYYNGETIRFNRPHPPFKWKTNPRLNFFSLKKRQSLFSVK